MFRVMTLTLVMCLLFGMITPDATAANTQKAQLIKGITYSYDIDPHQVTDPGHNKLIDGKDDPVIWYPPPPRRNRVNIDFDLASTYIVTRVEVDADRSVSRSRLQNLELYVDNGSGYLLAGKLLDLAGANYFMRLQDKPGPGVPPLTLRSNKPMTFTFDNINKECYQLRIMHSDGYQPGPNWGLTEVRIFGTPITEQVVSKAKSPQQEAAALRPYNVPDTKGKLILKEGNFDSDPDKELLLANKYISMVIEPSLGGVIGSFTYKGVEFTQPKNPMAPGGGGGFFSDHITGQSVDGDWFDVPYEYEVVENSPDRISVRLWASGKPGSLLMHLTFNKTITIRKDRSDVEIDYNITLDEKAVVPLPFGFWFHNYVGTRTADGEKSSDFNIYIPGDKGIQELDWSKFKRSGQWFNNVTRGWAAIADTKNKVGLAFSMDYRYLMNLYSWGSRGSKALPTLEWRFNEITIPQSGSFKTSFTITPFKGVDKLSGAGSAMVGTISYDKSARGRVGKVTATVISAKKQQGNATLRYRVLPTGQWQTLLEKPISLDVDQPLLITTNFQPAAEGTHVFSLVVEADGEELLDMEEPVSIGKPQNDYAMRAKMKKIGKKSTKVNLQYISMDYETPHVKWARPYHGGKTKALILMDSRYQREIIELAQRIDLDFDSTYLFPIDVGEALSDYYGKSTVKDQVAGLKRLLSDNPDWEVLVMAGYMFRYFSPEQREYVRKRIEDGCGLVIVQPDSTDPLPLICPLQNQGDLGSRPGRWSMAKKHYITNGIPWRAMPDGADWYTYQVAKEATVLAKVKNNPLVAVSNYGKGRVVAFAYRSGAKEERKNFFGITPYMTDERYGSDLVPTHIFDYHEYHFSLLAKSILWAADKVPQLRIDTIHASKRTVTLKLDNTTQDWDVTVEMKVTDKYGNTLAEVPPKAQRIAAGKSTIKLPIPVSLGNGVNLFDVFIRDSKGNVIDWASTSIKIAHPIGIAKMTDDVARAKAAKKIAPVYHAGDTLELHIELTGDITPGLSLLVKAIDGFGRVTVENTVPVTSNNIKMTIPMDNPVNMLLTLHAELLDNGKTLDIHEITTPVELPLPVKPHDGEPTLLGWNFTSTYGLNNYLIPSFLKLLSEMGFNAGIVMGRDDTNTSRESYLRNNMLIQSRTSTNISRGARPKDYDPEHPKRNPTLLNSETLKSQADGIAGIRHGANVFSFQAGDEASYSPGTDIDFSAESLSGMRQWLQSEYPNLDALNQQWGTQFASWQQVTPLTLKETRARGDNNYSSWSDHRSWGEMTIARFYGIMGDAATKAKPGTFFGPSGNPGVGVWGGYDFWQLSKTLTGLWAYGGSDELSLWSRDKTKILKYASFAGPNHQRVRNYGTFFTGTSGIAVCGTQRLPAFDWTDSRASTGYRLAWLPLKRGIGRAIHEATRIPDPIAVHYSRNSSRIAHVLDLMGVWRETRWKIQYLFQSCGFDHGWISYEQVENGNFGDVKVIFLPGSFTLSDKEVASLEKFVKNGGTIIGELGIGIADEHGKMLPKGRLDHVFGIERTNSKIAMRKDKAVRTATATELKFPEMPVAYIEFGLKAAGAKVLATAKENKVPLAFTHQYGKGQAIYLACDLPTSYMTLNDARGVGKNPTITAETEDFISAVCNKAGVARRMIFIPNDSDERIAFARPVIFAQGDIRYYGILRNYGLAQDFAAEPVNVTIKFTGGPRPGMATKGYVREIFSDTDFGLTDQVETFFKPTTMQIYSWCPYKVDRIDLELSKDTFAPGEVVSYNIALKASARMSTHTLYLGVFDPDGNESKPYTRNLTAKKGKAQGTIPLALNDKKGTWKIKVKDIVSGVETEESFVIK